MYGIEVSIRRGFGSGDKLLLISELSEFLRSGDEIKLSLLDDINLDLSFLTGHRLTFLTGE